MGGGDLLQRHMWSRKEPQRHTLDENANALNQALLNLTTASTMLLHSTEN